MENTNRKELTVHFPHLLRMARQNAKEAVELGGLNGGGGGFEWSIAMLYQDAAYGHAPVSLYEQFSRSFDIYGQG